MKILPLWTGQLILHDVLCHMERFILVSNEDGTKRKIKYASVAATIIWVHLKRKIEHWHFPPPPPSQKKNKNLWANNEALVIFMQSRSCQFSLHIDFSKISPTDYALRGTKRMLIQYRSQEHLHNWVSQGESAWITPQRKIKRKRERGGEEIGILLLLRTTAGSSQPWTNTDAQFP